MRTKLYNNKDQFLYILPLIVLIALISTAIEFSFTVKVLITVPLILLGYFLFIKVYRMAYDQNNVYLTNYFKEKCISFAQIESLTKQLTGFSVRNDILHERGYIIMYKEGLITKEAEILIPIKFNSEVTKIQERINRSS